MYISVVVFTFSTFTFGREDDVIHMHIFSQIYGKGQVRLVMAMGNYDISTLHGQYNGVI